MNNNPKLIVADVITATVMLVAIQAECALQMFCHLSGSEYSNHYFLFQS